MDKSKICTRAVNLVKNNPCNKKTNLLVYVKSEGPDPPKPRKEVYLATPLTSPKAKKIRVCTGAELKKMCPPKLCDCDEKKPSAVGSLGRILGFGLKGALAGTLIYWTCEIGLWGPPDETEMLYKDLCHITLPMICPESKKGEDDKPGKPEKIMSDSILCEMQTGARCHEIMTAAKTPCDIPNIGNASHRMAQLWNKSIVNLFSIVEYGPQKLSELSQWIKKKLTGKTDEICEEDTET